MAKKLTGMRVHSIFLKAIFSDVHAKPNGHVEVSDRDYMIVSKKFIEKVIPAKFPKWLAQTAGASRWHKHYDCDNFARALQVFANSLHANAKDPSRAEGYAVGRVHYKKAGLAPHAINVVIMRNAKWQPVVKYIEPQTGRYVTLSKTEEESRWFIDF